MFVKNGFTYIATARRMEQLVAIMEENKVHVVASKEFTNMGNAMEKLYFVILLSKHNAKFFDAEFESIEKLKEELA